MDSDEETLNDEVDSGNASSGDDFDFAMECQSGDSRERTNDADEYPFEVLTTEEIVQHMDNCIEEVNTVVEIPATITRILLNHFKWDKEKLMERFYDGDQDKLFAEAKVVNPFRKRSSRKTSTNGTEDCGICFTTFPLSMMTGLECDHRFCADCWGGYLTNKIMEEGVGQTISCAAPKCVILVDDATVMRLVKDAKVKLKYQHLITNSFVECNRLLKWCPAPGCSRAIKVQYVESKPVTCQCTHTFCFHCSENRHDPVSCNLLRKWTKKCNEDAETAKWMSTNTKQCPKCNVLIEKNGGCNHMWCKNGACLAEFCWLCLGPWAQHIAGGYRCNLYTDTAQRAHLSLQRYLFYYKRWMNHLQSLKFENNLYTMVKQTMLELQQHNMSWIEVQFLKKAVNILCLCRQTLTYTYAFAYYLRKNNQSAIFEDNQKDLEGATELLSEYLEKKITSENIVDIKQKVQDKYRYCDNRRKVLVEHVHEGYEKEWWDYYIE